MKGWIREENQYFQSRKEAFAEIRRRADGKVYRIVESGIQQPFEWEGAYILERQTAEYATQENPRISKMPDWEGWHEGIYEQYVKEALYEALAEKTFSQGPIEEIDESAKRHFNRGETEEWE